MKRNFLLKHHLKNHSVDVYGWEGCHSLKHHYYIYVAVKNSLCYFKRISSSKFQHYQDHGWAHFFCETKMMIYSDWISPKLMQTILVWTIMRCLRVWTTTTKRRMSCYIFILSEPKSFLIVQILYPKNLVNSAQTSIKLILIILVQYNIHHTHTNSFCVEF